MVAIGWLSSVGHTSHYLQDIFIISHSPSGMETGKSKSEERSQLLTDPVVTGIAYEINKANKQLNQHRLQVSTPCTAILQC